MAEDKFKAPVDSSHFPLPRLLRDIMPWFTRSGVAVLDQGLISGSNFLISILLARWLGPDQYGAYALAFSIFVLLSLLYQALLLEPMAVFGGSSYWHSLGGYLNTLLRLHLAIALLIAVALGSGALLASHYSQSASLPGAFAGIAIAAPCILLLWLVRRSFYLELSPYRAAAGSFVYCTLVSGGLWLSFRGGRISPFLAFLLMALAAMAAVCFLATQLKTSFLEKRKEFTVNGIWAKHWSYGRWALAGCFASWIPAYIYYPLLSSLSGMAHAGELRALMNLALPMEQIQAALSLLFLPYAARLYAASGPHSAGKFKTKLTLLSVGVAIGYWMVLILFRGPVFKFLYSGRYEGLVTLVPWVAVGSVFWSAVYGPAVVLRAMESPKSIFIAYGAASLVSVVIGIPATRYFGLAGGIWGINVSDITSFAMVFWLLRSKLKLASDNRGVELHKGVELNNLVARSIES